MRTAATFVLLAFCALPLSSANAVASDAVRLDAAIRATVPAGFAGAVLIARGDRVILDRGYGPGVKPRSQFWIASGGKQFTAAAILKCQEKQWLHLDDPLERFFLAAPADKRGITIRQLLSHTSGFGQSYASEGVQSRDEAVRRMLTDALVDAPGQHFHYSNTNYQLAVAIVEIASGMPYRRFIHTQLWQPAGLTLTGFAGEPGAHAVLAAKEPTPARLTRAEWGGEGVFSATSDLFRWHRALVTHRVLSEASTALLFTPVVDIQEGRAALGWFVGTTGRGSPFVFTRGNEDFGPNSLVYFYPKEQLTVVVLTHAGDADDTVSWSRAVLRKIQETLAL
jgi:CubicO group peptidase (beta-lactamase class C family)